MKILPPIHIDTIQIAGCYLSALINGDYSGLSDEDQTKLDEWFKEYHESGTTYIFQPGDEPNFTRDCVSNLMADCYETEVFEV